VHRWISGTEAAVELGVTRTTIRAWIRAGVLKGYVVGKVTRVHPESVRRIVGSEAQPTPGDTKSDRMPPTPPRSTVKTSA
jgi:excisionase family DNA binding protein